MKTNVFIYVCQQGWVLVGRKAEVQTDAIFEELSECAVIRRWGTSNGLGQLAREGPLEQTILEPEPAGVRINLTDVKRIIPCDPVKWKGWK